MYLKRLGQILGRTCLTSLLTTMFFGILWIIVYALENVMLTKVIGYIELVWFLITVISGFPALMCCIWSDIFD